MQEYSDNDSDASSFFNHSRTASIRRVCTEQHKSAVQYSRRNYMRHATRHLLRHHQKLVGTTCISVLSEIFSSAAISILYA